jgi:serine/threonine protein kinase
VRVLVREFRPADERWSQEFRGFLSKCLVKDERGRATTSQLLTEPFVAGCLEAESCKTSVLQLVMELERSGVGNLDLAGLKQQLAAAVGATFSGFCHILSFQSPNRVCR